VVKEAALRDTHYFCSSTNTVRSNKGRFHRRGVYCAWGSYETRKELELENLNARKEQVESLIKKQDDNNNNVDHKGTVNEAMEINHLIQGRR
jgi:hypothetical protein